MFRQASRIQDKEILSSQNINFSLYTYVFLTVVTSHLRSTVVPLGKGTPGTSREIYSEYADAVLIR